MHRFTAAVGVAFVLAMPAIASDRKPDEPFYRRFLVPGDPLDEKILEQEKRVQANPTSALLHNDFGNLLAQRRFPKEAREQYEIAMKLDNKGFLAPYNLGLLYETEGKISRAISAYEKSADLNRGFPPSLFRLGRLYEKQGLNSRAIELYSKALRIDASMRDPKRNPLVADTRLLDRVSLANYERDMATASLSWDARYGEESRFRKVPVDRAVSSGDIEPDPAAPAAGMTPAPSLMPPTLVPGAAPRAPQPIPAAPGQTRPQALQPAPPGAPPPPTHRIMAPLPTPLPQ